MTCKEARTGIIKLLAYRGWYMVVYNGHFISKRIHVLRCGRPSNIYAALYESFYDVVSDDEEIFNFIPKSKTVRGLLREFRDILAAIERR